MEWEKTNNDNTENNKKINGKKTEIFWTNDNGVSLNFIICNAFLICVHSGTHSMDS